MVQTSAVDHFILVLLQILPSALSSLLRSAFPEWTLPGNIVLKKQKDDWEDEFDVELATYEKLKCLQGHIIPRLLGEIECEGTRALVFSDLGGASMADAAGATLKNGTTLSESEFRRLSADALGALAACGILHDDLKLDNFLRLENHKGDSVIMIVDLEQVYEVESKEERLRQVEGNADLLAERYGKHLTCMRNDGLLPAE
jgi:hypothetical protein